MNGLKCEFGQPFVDGKIGRAGLELLQAFKDSGIHEFGHTELSPGDRLAAFEIGQLPAHDIIDGVQVVLDELEVKRPALFLPFILCNPPIPTCEMYV